MLTELSISEQTLYRNRNLYKAILLQVTYVDYF